MSTKQLPSISRDTEDALELLAEYPEVVWQLQSEQRPKLMQKVDLMLIAGMTPEWILQRGAFFDLPVGVQTVFLNALHWRQRELRRTIKAHH